MPEELLERDCSSCIFWKPETIEHLCFNGNCSKDYPIITQTNRYELCEKFKEID